MSTLGPILCRGSCRLSITLIWKNNAEFPCQLASQPSKPRLQTPNPPTSFQPNYKQVFVPALCRPATLECPSSTLPFLVTFIQKVLMSSWSKLFFKKNRVIISLVCSNGHAQADVISITYRLLILYLCWLSHTGGVRQTRWNLIGSQTGIQFISALSVYVERLIILYISQIFSHQNSPSFP